MSNFNQLPGSVQKSLTDHSLLKVISGLSNFKIESVVKIAKASCYGGADLIDIACSPEIVKEVAKNCDIPICVSSVEPELFLPAIQAGAEMIEIGNFDSFYPNGRFFDSEEVLDITRRTRSISSSIFLSVTIPHTLPFHKQGQLAIQLVENGADAIQTEGSFIANPKGVGIQGLIENAVPTLAATYSIKQSLETAGYTEIPVICASGLSAVTIPMAFVSGASGVGVGSAVNKLETEIEMIASVKNLRKSSSLLSRKSVRLE